MKENCPLLRPVPSHMVGPSRRWSRCGTRVTHPKSHVRWEGSKHANSIRVHVVGCTIERGIRI